MAKYIKFCLGCVTNKSLPIDKECLCEIEQGDDEVRAICGNRASWMALVEDEVISWEWHGSQRAQVRKTDDGTWAEARFNRRFFPRTSGTPQWDMAWSQCLDEAKTILRKAGKSASCLCNIEIEEWEYPNTDA